MDISSSIHLILFLIFFGLIETHKRKLFFSYFTKYKIHV